MDDVSGIGSQKATTCVHFIKHDTLTHTKVMSITSPGDDTEDYDCYHENKVTHRVWSFVDDVSGIRSQKATECVHFTEHDELTHTEVMSTMSPSDDTQDYYENKVARRVWRFVDDVSGIGSLIATDCIATFYGT